MILLIMPLQSDLHYLEIKMFNLLPHENKIAIRREFHFRLTFVALIALFLALVIFCVLLLPSYVVSKVVLSGVTKEKQVVEQSLESRESSDLKNRLASAKEDFVVLEPRAKEMPVGQIIDKVVTLKNSGVRINKIEYFVLADSKRQVAISGISDDRDSLLAFKNKLSESKLFSSIVLPVSDFTDESNIEFHITLIGNF